MTPYDSFPPIDPRTARERFLIRDDQWEARFRPDFNQFIIATFAYALPVIRLPVPSARTGNHALFLVTGGAVTMTIGQQTVRATAGQLTIIPALQIFAIDDIAADTTGFMCFFSQETLLQATDLSYDFLKLTNQPLLTLTQAQEGYLTVLFDRLTAEYVEWGASRTDLIWPYLRVLLAEINRVYATTVPPRTDHGDRLVQAFMDLLNRPPLRETRVNWYADQLHISPNHLNKVIKSRTGQSPSVWIDQQRVLEAKVMLYQSTFTIGQIAAELGFSDQSNFGKLFRRYTRMSPSVFRAMIDFNQG